MEYKFKLGDMVHVKFTEMFSTCFGGVCQNDPGINSKITDRRVHPEGKSQYKLRGFTGWWDECTLSKV